jgi:enoyl-CoA hydratase/carnithine racemase
MFRVGRALFSFSKQAAESTAEKKILIEQYKNFAKITLNNPKALNSLTLDMIKELRSLLPQLDKTKAFWIEGAGGKAFSAGGDVKSLYLQKESNPSILADFFREEYILDYKMARLNSLQISNWNGFVMGGGAGLSVFSPFRIATENTVFAMP